MPIKSNPLTVTYTAWDTSANTPKAGDAAHHTLRLIRDGVESTPINSPSEVDATNAKGEYKLTLTAAEMNVDFLTLCGVSSTANVSIIPVKIVTDDGDLAAIRALIGGGTVATSSPVAQGGAVKIIRGDDYKAADGRALTWTGNSADIWPDLTGATIAWKVLDTSGNVKLSVTGSVITPTGTQQVIAEPSASQTASLTADSGQPYKVVAVLSDGDVCTLVTGYLQVVN